MRSVLITGAASGIGLATARQLQESYNVHALVRKTSDTTELDKLNITKIIADLTSTQQVQEALTHPFDVVINNACQVLIGTCETCTIDEQQADMDINYFGHVRVLQATLPHMRAQKSGQIINISSVAGYEPFPHLESYVASKWALESLSESLATHLSQWNIKVSLIEPGGVKTKAPGDGALGTRPIKEYQEFCLKAKQQMKDSYSGSMEPSVIAELIEEILETDKPHLRYPVGDFAKARAKARFQDPTGDQYVTFKKEWLASTLNR